MKNPTKNPTKNPRQLFQAERLVYGALMAVGIIAAVFSSNLTAMGWSIATLIFWRYSCMLEDRLAELEALL